MNQQRIQSKNGRPPTTQPKQRRKRRNVVYAFLISSLLSSLVINTKVKHTFEAYELTYCQACLGS